MTKGEKLLIAQYRAVSRAGHGLYGDRRCTGIAEEHGQILLPAQWYKAYLQKRWNRKRHMQAVRQHAGT